MMRRLALGPLLLVVVGATVAAAASNSVHLRRKLQAAATDGKVDFPAFGEVVRMDEAAMAELIAPDAKIELLKEELPVLTTVFEGPLWRNEDGGYLLFSDVKNDKIMKYRGGDISTWKEDVGCYLSPNCAAGKGILGPNGLATNPRDGTLTMCQHGERRVARMNPDGSQTTLAGEYLGKKLNSPNDLTFSLNGDLFFTDPPYGLPAGTNDTLGFAGVYRVPAASISSLKGAEGEGSPNVELLTNAFEKPNGLALSPDQTRLYVGESKFGNSSWYVLEKDKTSGKWGAPRPFAGGPDSGIDEGNPLGSNDGMKTDTNGNLWASGRGGVVILSPDGKQLGLISTAEKHTSNVAFAGDGYLYITGLEYLARIPVLAKGLMA